MDTQQRLSKQFNTILVGGKPYQTTFYHWNGQKKKEPSCWSVSEELTGKQPLCEDLAVWKVWDERVQMLGRLFIKQNPDGRQDLIQLACEGMKTTHRPFGGHLFVFLAKYDGFRAAFEIAMECVQIDERSQYLLGAISNMLKFDWGVPTDDELEECVDLTRQRWKALDKPEYTSPQRGSNPSIPFPPNPMVVEYQLVRDAMGVLVNQLQLIQHERLKADLLTGENLEINQDKEVLTSELSRLGFSPALVQSLEHAENEYRKAESEFDFKTSADHNRSFFDELLDG